MSEVMNGRNSLISAVIDSLITQPEYEARAYVGDYEKQDDDLEFFQGIIDTAFDGDYIVHTLEQDHGTIYRFIRRHHA